MAEHVTNSFVSCIKVKGIHLLPPIITQKRRAELQGYKQQAIKLEKRLQNCRDLKKNLEEILKMQSIKDRPQSEITFPDDSHIEALGITDDVINNSKIKTPRHIRLTNDIVDVTQYDSDGVKIICSDASSTMFHQGQYLCSNNSKENTVTDVGPSQLKQIETLFPLNKDINKETRVLYSKQITKPNVEPKKSNRSCSESYSVKDISSSLEKSPKPRLIRSNSYTLDTPSPILLAHLEKIEKSNIYDQLRSHEDKKLPSISRNWSSLENNYVPFENSEFSSLNTVYNTNLNDSNKEDLQSITPIDKIEIERNSSPSIQVFHTDISVQKITVNANNDVLNDTLNENSETSDSQLLQVLKTLPDVYAKQIIDLIEAQKLEKQKAVDCKMESEENINSLDRIPDRDGQQNTANDNNKYEEIKNYIMNVKLHQESHNIVQQNISLAETDHLLGSTSSLSPSQSVYYSLSCDTLRPVSNTSLRLPDFDCDNIVFSDEKFDTPNKEKGTESYRQRMNVNRELFPQVDNSKYKDIKQEWAASIIGAHVKGYLTRRLLKTDRVQSLIETIKDALLCALQLHNSEHIDESDVELHRRLINQVSAACYTFHDIFFSLAVQEQMLIISTDRQRKLEKAKRPASAPTSHRSKSSSSRSTPRPKLSSNSQSLTIV